MKKLFVILICSIISYGSNAYAKAFVELDVSSFGSLNFKYSGGSLGVGYKYELDYNFYFGYFLANANIGVGTSAFILNLEEFHWNDLLIKPTFNLEYGYEFVRKSLFSFGFNASGFLLYDEHQGHRPPPTRFPFPFHIIPFIGVFGNFNISDSIAIELKAKTALLGLLFQIKGRYYF